MTWQATFSDANVQCDTPNSDVMTANASSRKLPYQGKHRLHMVMLAHLLTDHWRLSSWFGKISRIGSESKMGNPGHQGDLSQGRELF